MSKDLTEKKEIYAIATDPIYIGTGGYTIGRVDNTIVRDPITRIPKIPGSSIAGTWRYYVTLELISKVKDFQPEFNEIKNSDGNSLDKKIKSWCKSHKSEWEDELDEKIKKLCEEINQNNNEECKKSYNWLKYHGNVIAKITCAGQDNVPGANIDSPDQTNNDGKTGHCGHCIVCKAFGYSKANQSWQGMLLFSDLQILLFPVFTRFGVKWITSERLLEKAKIIKDPQQNDNRSEKSKGTVIVQKSFKEGETKGYINLGWLNLPYKTAKKSFDLSALKEISPFSEDDIIIVPESLLSQIINSNLEVRTSVSIDPITGAAKDRALFTSEAIPRGTVFYGIVRAFDKKAFSGNANLPDVEDIWAALEDSKKYYETLGIGGMTTRGFGRLKIHLFGS